MNNKWLLQFFFAQIIYLGIFIRVTNEMNVTE